MEKSALPKPAAALCVTKGIGFRPLREASANGIASGLEVFSIGADCDKSDIKGTAIAGLDLPFIGPILSTGPSPVKSQVAE